MIDDIDLIDEIDEIDAPPTYPLASAEAETLTRCEAVIARGVQTFIEVGEALAEIRDGKLYRADFTTFEHYCRNKWGIGDSRARQLIGAAAVAREIETVTNVTLSNEGQARAIAKAAPADRPAVLTRADELAGDQPRTAKHITQAAVEIAQPDLPIDFSIVQRRLASHGVTLTQHGGAFTLADRGGATSSTRVWDQVLDRLSLLEDGMEDAPPTPAPPALVSEPDHGASDNAAAYDAAAARDDGRLERAYNFINAFEYEAARAVLGGIEKSTYARDQLLATIPTGRQITLALTFDECAALRKEAKAFESSGLITKLPTIGQALTLLIAGIRGAQ